jgi:aspartyl-tRNA(Asn)/glutamyl-tRNA(Gln) amidotransferase subunit C
VTLITEAIVPLNLEDILKLGELARLEIDAAETADLQAKLTDIVAFVDQLKGAATGEVEPMAHPLERTQRLRVDQVTETDEHERLQQNAPLVERDLYLVPKVID